MLGISFQKRFFKQMDWWIIGAVLILTGFGIVVIDGTTSGVAHKEVLAERQAMWWGIALGAFIFVLLFDYTQLVKLAIPSYLACIALLAGLFVSPTGAINVNGATSWYDFGPVRLQPSEFTKIVVVLVASGYLGRIKGRRAGFLDMIVVGLIVLVPVGFIALQPDFGTAATFLLLIPVLPWVAGARRRIYAILCGTGLLLVLTYGSIVVARGGDYPGLSGYQEERINSYLSRMLPIDRGEVDREELLADINRRSGWAPLQARIALGSGQWFGKGWRQGTQSSMEFLPEAQTDYIFASCGEQFGFAGCAFVLALYLLIVYRSLSLALRSKDWLGYFIIVGFLTVFISHIFINLGVATDLLPVTGLPLPFLSVGGSFLVTLYIGFGLVVSIGMRKWMF